MKIFSLYREKNIFEIYVYESLEDFTNRIEWQDVLNEHLIILDEHGNIYKWDKSKTNQFSTTYNYTLAIKKTDAELGKICQQNYALNNFSNEFTIEM